jgi:hypothetical protein
LSYLNGDCTFAGIAEDSNSIWLDKEAIGIIAKAMAKDKKDIKVEGKPLLDHIKGLFLNKDQSYEYNLRVTQGDLIN